MNRTIVVTGSASGIGKASAELLAAQGDCVIGVDVHDADVIADLSTADGRRIMIETVTSRTKGSLDGVLACAGVAKMEPITLAVNYFGAVATLDGLRPLLARGKDPRAVVVSSLALITEGDHELVEACLAGNEPAVLAAAATKGEVTYNVAKRAIARWVRRHAIMSEWVGAGILLNGIAPGLIQTAMTQPILDDPQRLAALMRTMPLPIGHYSQPDSIGHLAVYLLSPENCFMVGQVIFADGGSEAAIRGEAIW